jgi:hypothetical protein
MLIRQIRTLLYEQGFTIGGARQQMVSSVVDIHETKSLPLIKNTLIIREIIEELEEALSHLA